MIIGYVRVSTVEQNEERQIQLLQQYNVEKFFIDKQSGKNTDRPQFQEMMKFVREGDTLVIESYSRLARSTKDLLSIVEQLQAKNVILLSDKEKIDTSTPTGKLFLTIIAGLAEFERSCMLERQREGIEAAKKAGKYKGRRRIKVDEKRFVRWYTKWRNNECTARYAMAQLSLKPDTFYRRVKEYEEKNGITKNSYDCTKL